MKSSRGVARKKKKKDENVPAQVVPAQAVPPKVKKGSATYKQLVHAFELGYFGAMSRVRRELPQAWRAGVLATLSNTMLAVEVCEQLPQWGKQAMPHVHGFKLVIMRCESAAAMLSWRKELAPVQIERLREAVEKLRQAAAQLGVA
jgi:hypothetical protein